jgi:hypothetical protein
MNLLIVIYHQTLKLKNKTMEETTIFLKKLDYQLEKYNKSSLNEASVFDNIKNIMTVRNE